jgi:hypothetical protein
MSDLMAIIAGLAIGTSIISVFAFIFAYFNAKKEAKKGPIVISVDGRLNLNKKDFLVLILVT